MRIWTRYAAGASLVAILIVAAARISAPNSETVPGADRPAAAQGSGANSESSERVRSPVAGAASVGVSAATDLATVGDFDAAYDSAIAGDKVAARRVAIVASQCASLKNQYSHKDDSPYVSSISGASLAAARYQGLRIKFCHSLDDKKLARRSALMWDAAKAGDRDAILRLRYFAPIGAGFTEQIPGWKNDVVGLLAQLGDDPDALMALADIYAKGRIAKRDIPQAIDYYTKVVAITDPKSNLHSDAEEWIRLLSGISAKRR